MDDYEPRKVLGEGSFGKVYLMKHKESKDLVCTKVIKLKNMKKKEQDACHEEAALMQRLKHPNICGFRDSFIYKNCLCIIMEYCDSGDLGGRVTKQAKEVNKMFTETKIMHWFIQIALGIHYMHRRHILHRDIKTQNIFITGSGRIVLGDLGISKVMEGTMDFASTCIGTPYYMSPEIFQNAPYNHKSDVWAIGCVLYELATLKHAFDGESLNGLACKIIKGRYPAPSNRYTRNLRGLIKDMLNTNPRGRPDIEQVLKKPSLRPYLATFLDDLKKEKIFNQSESMDHLSEQLEQLGLSDMLATGSNTSSEASSPSSSVGTPASPSSSPRPSSSSSPPSSSANGPNGGSRQQQQHQLEIEEEKREAAELALERLRAKAEDRKRRSFTPRKASRSRISLTEADAAGAASSAAAAAAASGAAALSSPTDGPSPSSSRPTSASSKAGGSGGSAVGEEGQSTPGGSRNRRPSLLARLAGAARRGSTSKSPEPSGVGGGVGGGGGGDAERAESPSHRRSTSSTRPSGSLPPTPQGSSSSSSGSSSARGAPTSPPRQMLPPASPGSPRRPSAGVVDLPPLNIPAASGSGNVRSGSNSPVAGGGGHSRTPSRSPGGGRARRPSIVGDEMLRYLEGHKAELEEDMTDRERKLKEQLAEAEERCKQLKDDLKRQSKSNDGARPKSASGEGERDLELSDSEDEGAEGGEDEVSAVITRLSMADGEKNAAGGGGAAGGGRGKEAGKGGAGGGGGLKDGGEDVVSPYPAVSMSPTEDKPTPVGRLVDRVNFLKERCIKGLGAEKFKLAFDLLVAMQDEGNGWVTYEGQKYDGADDDQVQALLEKVIGADKLQYWNLMDQLILMGV